MMTSSWSIKSEVAALLVVLSLGCGAVGGARWLGAHAAGDRAYSAGRFDEAAEAYERAARIAERPRDREESSYAAAEATFRAGHTERAIAAFDRIAAATKPGERSVRAAFRAANLRLARGESARAYDALSKIFARAPEHGIARRALFAVIAHIDLTSGHAAAIDALRKLYPAFERNRLGEEILYALAQREEAIGAAREALDHDLLLATRYPYPTGALWDDALYHASLLHEALGEPKSAIADLERMLAVHETSDLNGSYDRPRMPAAALRIGELWRDRIGDHAQARSSFARVATMFPKSVLRARAIFAQGAIARDDGEAAEACRLGRVLIEQANDSRWARRADELCPALSADVERLVEQRRARRSK